MNKLLFPLFFVLSFLSFACSDPPSSAFTQVECINEEMPAYDGRKVSLLNDEGVPYKDTILEKIEKRRTVFKPCRAYIYIARFYSAEEELITESRIKMVATGQRWKYQPEMQDEVVIQYAFSESDKKISLPHQLNRSLPDFDWINEERTGVIENVEKVWMHPFRANQFTFTEVAPFPEVEFPLKVGKSWTGQLRIQQGWGDWENTSGNFLYEVVAREAAETAYATLQDCWKIKSRASYSFGASYLDYWFHDTLGFVKMDYRNYGGQRLRIELQEVRDSDQ
jgi:hypothetical protein